MDSEVKSLDSKPTLSPSSPNSFTTYGHIPDGIEVSYRHQHEGLYPYHEEGIHVDYSKPREIVTNPQHHPSPFLPYIQTEKPAKRFWTRPRICIAILVVLLLIAGGVVGGVLASRAQRERSLGQNEQPSSQGEGSGGSSSLTTTTTTTAGVSVTPVSSSPSPSASTLEKTQLTEALRPNSALAVTGWMPSTGGGFSIRLFYQGLDGNVRLSSYESSDGNWSSPTVMDFKAKDGTALTVTAIAEEFYFMSDPRNFQVELFYVTENNTLGEWTLRNGLGSNGSSTSMNTPVHPDTNLASFWPNIVYEADSGAVMQMTWNVAFEIDSVPVFAQTGTQLVEVPSSNNFTDFPSTILYRNIHGNLEDTRGNRSTDWKGGNLSAAIPDKTRFGAFSICNKRKAPNLDTYVLYQDKSGAIQMAWQDDEAGWKGPVAPAALQIADNGTAITCLTRLLWPTTTLPRGYVDMSRCYFQSSGRLTEAQFNGSDWTILGTIPI